MDWRFLLRLVPVAALSAMLSQIALAQSVPIPETPPSPTASCTVTALNRTAPLQADYSFTIYNIPGSASAVGIQNAGNTTPAAPFRVRAVCSDGTVGETQLAFPAFGSTVVYTGELHWRALTPIPLALNVSADLPRLGSGQTTQVRSVGVLADASTIDVTGLALGTLYTSSNPLIATVSDAGIVTAAALVSSGSSSRVVITGQHEGVSGSAVVEIGPRGRLAGRVLRADGVSPAAGAQVSIVRNQPRDTVGIVTADAGGLFALEDVAAGTFSLSAVDPVTGDIGRGDTSIATTGDTGNADIRMNGQATLTVNVVNATDAPVANALVTFTSLSGFRDVRSLQTDSAGRAIFPRALAGLYTVSTRDTGSLLVGAASGNLLAGVDASVTLKLQPVASIGGVVYALDGVTAQGGVQVRLVSAVRGIITQLVTAADGAFAFDSLPLSDSPYTLDAFQNGRLRARVSGIIPTAGGQQITRNIVFGPAGTVTGTVLRSNGGAAVNATVTVQSQVGERFTFTARTDAQGVYRIEAVPVGAFGITASGSNGEVATGGGNVSTDGQTVTVDLQLATNGVIGTVFQRNGSTPVGAGVSVRLNPGNITTTTNAAGQYGFSISQPNKYDIEASDTNGNRGRTEVVLTSIGAGGPVTANVTFLGRGTVQGVVRDPSQVPQPGVSVSISSSSVFGGTATATTDAQGAYRFEGVFVGDFTVYANNVSTGLAGVAQARVSGEGVTVAADVTLAATGTVTGQVVKQDNTTAVAGALVELFISGTRALSVTADGTGHFTFPAVPLGDFRLDATNPSDGDKGRTVSRLTTLNEVRTANIRLIGVGPVRVHAVDSGGVAVQGATVTLTSSSVFDQTLTAVTDASGFVSFARVFNGDFSVSGAKGAGVDLLSGSAVGTLVGGVTSDVELTLTSTPVGTVTGVVTRGLAADLQAGVVVRLQEGQFGAVRTTTTGPDGRYSFAQVEVNKDYRLFALVNGRVRARSDARLSSAGETFTRNLVLLGVGTVSGLVTNAQTQPQSGVLITLTNSDPNYGGTWNATTQGDGRYTIADVPAGNFVIRARSNDSTLQAQDSGMVRFDGDAVTVNLTLVNSAVTMPVTLYDANGARFDIQGNGGLGTGLNNVFRGDNAANTQGNRLGVIVSGVEVPFTNGDGSIGRRTQAGQLIEVDEFNQASGLDISRRVYVPKAGYFTRYLEVLENRTQNPITVNVRITSNFSQGEGGTRVVDSSNNDTILSVGPQATRDTWVVMDDERDDDVFGRSGNPPVVFVFDGADADTRAAEASTTVVGDATKLYWQWNAVTIPAGGSAGFLHFASQQVGRIASRSTAERLGQLPPEALEGLSADERAIIRNFRVPADGLSTLQPLPTVEGNTVSGVVFAGDGTTPIKNSEITFKNVLPYYGRTYRVTSNTQGAYTLQSRDLGESFPVAVVRGEFTAVAKHPDTSALTALAHGQFGTNQSTATQDLIFVGTGNLLGTVRRHNGAIVNSGSVSIPYIFPNGSQGTLFATIDATGSFQYSGISPGDYLISASQSHPQGQAIVGVAAQSVAVSASNTTLGSVVMENTGEVSGTVREADGDPAVGTTVSLGNIYRQTTTDTGGHYRFTDVRTGTQSVFARSSDNLTDSDTVNVMTDTVSVVDMQLSGVGTLVVQVNYQRGAPATSAQVVLNNTTARTTDGAGRVSFTVPAGVTQSVRAVHPDDTSFANLEVTGTAVVADHNGTNTLTLTLPPAGNIVGTVVRPDGSTLAANVSMTLRKRDGSSWQRTTTTSSTGTYRWNGLEPGPYTVSAADQATLRYADADANVTTDGQEVTVNLQLADNRIPLPADLRDGNDFQFDVQRGGNLATGSHINASVFSSSGGGGSQLLINGVAFAGDSSALLEAGRRQFAIAQPTQIAGLNVTRKIYVPFGAYFARYLEVLQNPTASPITVAVRIRNQYASTVGVTSSSSGDAQITAADTWGVVDNSIDTDPFTTNDAPPTAFVLGSGTTAVTHSLFSLSTSTRLEAEWSNVVVPAGARVILMHFDVQQVSRDGATAAAQRLQQLPPEAIQSLTPEELAAIVNFTMPTDGISTVPALPSLLGRVTGTVYEGDGVTIVPQVRIQVRSTHPLYGRTYFRGDSGSCPISSEAFSLISTNTGAFSLTGTLKATDSIALPVGSDVIVQTATSSCVSTFSRHHPVSLAPSPAYTGTIDATSGTVVRDVLFNSGILTGTILGPSDFSASGAQVQVSLPNVNTTLNSNSSAVYRITGVPPGTYTLNVTLSHNQGSPLRGSRNVTAVFGQTTVADINIEPTGSVTGAVLTANGEIAAGQSVRLDMNGRSFSRSTATDSLGRFNFSAVPIGTFVLSATDSLTSAVTSAQVTVNQNTVTSQNLQMIGRGSVQLTVNYARGVPAASSDILLQSSAAGSSFRVVGRTDGLGAVNVAVPVGTYTLRARHPLLSSASNDITGAIASNNESQTRTITLPALANVRVTVTDRDTGNAAVPNADLYLTDSSCTNCYAGSTNSSGQLLLSNVREGNYSVRIRAQDGRVASVGGVVNAAVDGQTIDKAASLSINDYTYGTLTFGEERQLYSVPVNAGDVIRLSVNGYGLNGNQSAYIVRAQVYDPSKVERVRGYGYDNRNSYSQFNELGDLQNIVAAATGSYTIAVSPYYDDEPSYLGGFRLQATVNGVYVPLQPYAGGGAVNGTVTRVDGTTPAANRLVQLSSNDNLAMRVRTRTATDGTFAFTGVPVAPINLNLMDEAGAFSIANATADVPAPGAVVTRNLVMPAQTTLQVQVTISDALNVPSQLYFTATDSGGQRQLGPVTFTGGSRTSSVATVDVYGPSITVRVVHPNNSVISTSATVTGADGTTVPVSLTLAAASLNGHVRNADGDPVEESEIEVRRTATNEYLDGTYTDSNGYYSISALPSGEELTVGAWDYDADVIQLAHTTLQQGQATTVDIQFAGTGTVTGRVLRANGSPAANVSVNAFYEYDERFHYETSRSTTTNANGQYTFSQLPVGRPLRISARLSTGFGSIYAEDTTTIATNGGSQPMNLQFVETGTTVTARVMLSDGRPLPGNCSFDLDFPGEVSGNVFGPCAGADFTNVPAGTGTLRASQTTAEVDYGPIPVTVTQGSNITADILVSVVKGVVRFSNGTPVPYPSMFLTPEVGERYLQRESFEDGSYSVFGVPAGNFALEAQDEDSGLTATVQGTLVDLNTPVVLDVTLPPSGTVIGTFRDRNNQPIPDATVYVRSSAVDLDRYATTDEDGNYIAQEIAVGTITVQAQDPNTDLVGVATGTLTTAGQEIRVDVSSPESGTLSGIVQTADGTAPVANALVTASTVTSYGPFGVLQFETTSNASGQYQFSALPIGSLRIVAESNNVLGDATVEMTAAGATRNVRLGTSIRLPVTLNGTDTSKYDITCDGQLNDGGYAGATDAYDGAYRLDVAGNSFPCVDTAGVGQNGREAIIGPNTLNGLRVSRRIYVPIAGGFARYLETLENPGTTDATVSVRVFSNLGSDSATRIVVAPSATNNRYAVTADNGSDPALAHVFGGTGGAVSATTQYIAGNDQATYTWSVTVPAGGRVSLLHFAVQRARSDTAAAQTQAEALASGTQAGMFDGLSSQDRSSIKNFAVAP